MTFARVLTAVHPVLFVLNGQPIFTYGIMLGVALCAAALLLTRLAEREGLPDGGVLLAFLAACVAGLLGSRVLYILVNLAEFDSPAAMMNMQRGGLVGYGAFVGAVAGGGVALRAQKINLPAVADIAAPCFAVMLTLGRVGCYAFGCDFGVPLSPSAPGWLKTLGTFPRWPPGTLVQGAGSPAWVQHVTERGLSPSSSASLPVHPTQLYEVLIGALLLCAYFPARAKQRFRGQIFLELVLAYGACRFALEVLRDDPERGMLPLTLPEHVLVALGLAALGGATALWVLPAIDHLAIRRASQAAALVPALVAFVLLRPASFGESTVTALSVTQLFALVTGAGAAYAFSRLHQAALADPEGAMSLVAVEHVEEGRPRKKKRRRKKGPTKGDVVRP